MGRRVRSYKTKCHSPLRVKFGPHRGEIFNNGFAKRRIQNVCGCHLQRVFSLTMRDSVMSALTTAMATGPSVLNIKHRGVAMGTSAGGAVRHGCDLKTDPFLSSDMFSFLFLVDLGVTES